MRARSLKPGFFKNEDLARLPIAARYLFAGLWCLADREGRLEDRPVRIQAEVFPYENQNVSRLLDHLATGHDGESGFITRYSVNGKKYIQIHGFKKHQNPHKKEADSVIPSIIVGNTKAEELPEPAPEIPAPARLTPDSPFSDSGLRTADSGLPQPGTARPEILMLIWNETAGRAGLPICTALGHDERLKHAADRWREKPDPAYWRTVAERIATSDFLRGSKGWRATFDFFVAPDTHVKVLEGGYDQGPTTNPKTAGNIDALTRFVGKEVIA